MPDERPAPTKDLPTVSADGESLQPLIDGVALRPAITQQDERGEICEIFSTAWGFDSDPPVYVYQASVRPGQVKGWVVHERQDDRLYAAFGTGRIVLFDAREGSPTCGMINQFTLGERRRALLRIPRGVYHAVQCVGTVDFAFVNLPTSAYRHDDPDKLRLPLDTPLIPFRF
jgi:dTDP-4-dehydrorhamnose 3,5-epimerase